MKNSRSLLSFIAVFAAGFLAGIVFSAWKLDSGAKDTPAGESSAQHSSKRAELQDRIAGIEKMLDKNPDNPAALVQLGNDYFDVGNYEKAVAAYAKAIKLEPGNADAVVDMGIAYRRLGKPANAATCFRQALQAKPNHATALFNLGIVLRDDLKDYPGALKAWEAFLENAKDSPFSVMVQPWVKQLREKIGEEGAGGGAKKE
ncbi:MAG: tetratricopeptide repeat protein [Pseudomonadota bacterium]